MLCKNEEKMKLLYERETTTLDLYQMGNEMKKVGNRWYSIYRVWPKLCDTTLHFGL